MDGGFFASRLGLDGKAPGGGTPCLRCAQAGRKTDGLPPVAGEEGGVRGHLGDFMGGRRALKEVVGFNVGIEFEVGVRVEVWVGPQIGFVGRVTEKGSHSLRGSVA